MVECPKCSTKLEIDFGMITCPKCHSVVFVEFDGTAKIAGDPAATSAPEAAEAGIEAAPSFPDIELPEFSMSQSEPSPSQVSISESVVETQSSEIVSPDDPLGVTAYANSEFSQAKDGPFVFNLFISGLDSKEIRESLREAMNDSRFGWDANQLLAQIRGGNLVLKNLSPVQTSILVNRLKRLPLLLSWEQHAITTVEKF